MKFPLGGKSKDYDSKKSREQLINMIAEVNEDGSYACVKRGEGLTLFKDTLNANLVRSNLHVNQDTIYFVVGDRLFSFVGGGALTNLGDVETLTGRAVIVSNSRPAGNQILVLNGVGDGYIFTVGGAFVKITDPDFFVTSSVTVLEERFWFARDGTNEFFGSEISDGFAYDPLTFGTAEESPDNVVAVIAKKSALWVLGTDTIEYFQTFNDTTFPLRKPKGVTKQRGIRELTSLAEIGDSFVWLADDNTVRMITDTTMTKISNLELELKIKGNGTTAFPGFGTINDVIGFFIDDSIHKIYYLSFRTEGYVWGYDLSTGVGHTRQSEDQLVWRVNSATIYRNAIIVGDYVVGKLWTFDPDAFDEDGVVMRAILQTPTVSWLHDVSIPLIELDMETSTTTGLTADPQMIVQFTKNGKDYQHHSVISLGTIGEDRTRVPLRNFGRIVRNKDFGLRLEFTDAEQLQLYGADAPYIGEGF